MLTAVYDIATGALVSETSLPVDGATLPPGLACTAFDVVPARRAWNPETRTYDAAAAPTRSRLTRLELLRRFTLEERVALKVAKTTSNDPIVRATLDVLEQMQNVAEFVDVADPETVQGVGYAMEVLVAAGVVASGNAGARMAEILAPVAE